LRAGKDKDPVGLEYLAGVRQQTGEDWAGVSLALSTAQPMLNAAPPELKSLEVSAVPANAPQLVGQPGAPPGAAGGNFKDIQQRAAAGRAQSQQVANSFNF